MVKTAHDHLRDKSYKIRYDTLEFPGGMPADIGFTWSWRLRADGLAEEPAKPGIPFYRSFPSAFSGGHAWSHLPFP
jgi:hypothetical protein